MTQRKLNKQDEKSLLLLKSSYQMHLKTREEAELRGKKESVERMDLILRDTFEQMAKIDPSFAQRCKQDAENKLKQPSFPNSNIGMDDNQGLFASIAELQGSNSTNTDKMPMNEEKTAENESFYDKIENDNVDIYQLADEMEASDEEIEASLQEDYVEPISEIKPMNDNIDPSIQYDLIPLPSKGQCYKNKKERLKVAYLTASDENLITSPNLYASGQISNVLLKRKVLDKDFNVDDLIAGDVDAIMVFLRGTSYGNDFPITATDPTTKKTIDTVVDLSKLSYKPFNLKGDDEGLFEFTTTRTKAKIKFKFLTKREIDILDKIAKKEKDGIASYELQDAVQKVKNVLKSDTNLSDADRNSIISANQKLEMWSQALNDKVKPSTYTKSITNTMEMQIVEVNGNRDKTYIHNFVMNMPASDSLEFRRYLYDNSPGVDFEISVKRPDSMGGGSFKCFLEWDDYVFWLIA